jgi:putative transposase
MDEILIKVEIGYVCLSVAMEPTDETIPGIRASIERSKLVAQGFIQSLIREYEKRSISTDGGPWYPQACRFLNVEHHFHCSYQKVSQKEQSNL